MVMHVVGTSDSITSTCVVVNSQGGGMDEALCRRLFQQLMVAVDYCHRLGIANRDIKVPPRARLCTCKESSAGRTAQESQELQRAACNSAGSAALS